ncbi:MAG: hypothetical protein ACO37C_04915 [Gemmobacter sp.]
MEITVVVSPNTRTFPRNTTLTMSKAPASSRHSAESQTTCESAKPAVQSPNPAAEISMSRPAWSRIGKETR